MKKRSFFYDWSLWPLLGINLYAIYYYSLHPDSYSTIVVLYWVQSVCIGFFNFLSLLTFSNTAGDENFEFNGKKNLGGSAGGCISFFFLIHYGIFHFVYIFFLLSMIDIHQISWQFLKISVLLIFVSTAMSFVQDKIRNQKEPVLIGTMFFLPYLRVIPMHLMILAPKFLNISAPYVFLILKTLADLLMHVIYQRWIFRPGKETKLQNTNF